MNINIKKTALASAILTVITTGSVVFAQQSMDDQSTNSANRYIVQYNQGQVGHAAEQMRAQMKNLIAMQGGNVVREIPRAGIIAAELNPHALKNLQSNPNILLVEPDPKRYLMAESTPYGISMVEANQVSDSNTGSMKVCITDTGYSLGHEDLPSTGVTGDDNDGLGNDTGNWYEDGHGHGSHVSGTIAAIGGNGVGVVGVNPSNQLGLHMVKIFNDAGGWAYGSDLVAAINQCIDSGAKVMSMSIGGPSYSAAEESAFQTAYNSGMVLIAAAGNDGNSADSYPASYSTVMSVAAVDSSGNRASFSQYPAAVEIAAPGVSVNSTLPNNSYASWDGTSMATPHVAGVAALVWSHYPSCTNAEIRQALNKSAEDRGSAGRDQFYGHGIVKAKAAFDMLASGCDVGPIDPPPPPPPPGELANGVPETGLSGAAGEELNYMMSVPSGSSNLSFVMSGGSGDADLYVKFGSAPTTSSYDCRPYSTGNNENCNFASPQTGDYYVMVRGYSSFSSVSLEGSYDGDVTPPPPPPAEIDLTVTKRIKGTTGISKVRWSGAAGTNIDLYRNGSFFKSTRNDGRYNDKISNASGTYSYQVCETDSTTQCSATVSVTF